MAFQTIKNVEVKGISACVPLLTESNKDLSLFNSEDEAHKFIEATGVESRHIVRGTNLCTSDLCFMAAKQLMTRLDWNPGEIDCLIFVSQTPDYIFPATACILQERLGLPTDCYSLDISLGCSGWVYGLSVIASLLATGTMKKGLLLVGDTTTVTKSPRDKSSYPLFGDAGSATALKYTEEGNEMFFNFGTDGRGYEAIIIPDGGFRNFYNQDSLIETEVEPGIKRNRLHSILNGPAVFTFGISRAPKSIDSLLRHFDINKDSIDYFVFHQANLFMNEKIRTKIKIDPEKVPYSLAEYGNTSSASIPLTIVTQLGSQLELSRKKMLACAFGVGLSWASVVLDLSHTVCPPVQNIDCI